MKASEINELQSRWTPDILAKVQGLLEESDLNTHAFPFPPVEVNGHQYIDLRGIKPDTALNLTAQYLDFSYSCFPPGSAVSLSHLQYCLFIGCTYGVIIGRTFHSCDFSQAKMRRFQCINRTRFEGCIFRGTDLSNADCDNAHFIDCDFTGARFLRAIFFQCVFDGCRFEKAKFGEGSLGGSVFRNSKESFIWTDYDTDQRMEHVVPGATVQVDLRKTLLSIDLFQ